ncbi:MAG: tetratricopeptide repeat protein [Candidatus Heimdallarchaeota archaeon]
MLSEIQQLIDEGKYTQAHHRVQTIERGHTASLDDLITLQILESQILAKIGKYSASFELAEKTFTESKRRKLPLRAVDSLIVMAEALENLGRFDDSLKAAQQAEEMLSILVGEYAASSSGKRASIAFRKSRALMRKGDFDPALDFLEIALALYQKAGNKRDIAHSLNSIGIIFVQKGQLDNALEYCIQSLQLREEIGNKQEIADSLSLLGSIHHKEGDIDLALDHYQRGLALQKEVGNERDISRSLNNIGIIYQQKGELDQALDYYRQSLALREELGNKQDIAMSFNNIGVIYRDKGELDNALECYQQSLALNEETGSHRDIAYALNNIGEIHARKGELDLALESHKRSLALREQIGNNQYIAASLNNIGHVYYYKGEMTLALEYYEQSLALREAIGNQQHIVLSLVNIGTMHQQMGDLNQALSRLSHCLALCKEMGNNLLIAMTLFELTSVTLDMNSREEANLYLNELGSVNERAPNKLISQQYRLARALFLKTSTRPRDRGKAEELFDQVLNEEIIDQQLTIIALLNQCDLLIVELHSSSDPDVLHEVQSHVSRLSDIASDQHSHWLLAETFVLKSKLALVELDLKRAQRFLSEAQRLAEKWGMTKLAIKVSTDYDAMLVQLNRWEELLERNASLLERLELADLENIFRRMLRKHAIEVPQTLPEDPVMLLILSDSGICLFSRIFEQEGQLEDQLVGAFITAITRLGTNIFEDSETIDRIVYREHTLAVKRLDSLRFIYAFKGQSYTALQKLDQFMRGLEKSSLSWKALQRVLETSQALRPKEQEEINRLLNRIFFS